LPFELVSSRLLWVLVKKKFPLLDLVESAFLGEVDFRHFKFYGIHSWIWLNQHFWLCFSIWISILQVFWFSVQDVFMKGDLCCDLSGDWRNSSFSFFFFFLGGGLIEELKKRNRWWGEDPWWCAKEAVGGFGQ